MKTLFTSLLTCFILLTNAQEILLDSIIYISNESNSAEYKSLFEYDSEENLTALKQTFFDSPDDISYYEEYFKYNSNLMLDSVILKEGDAFLDLEQQFAIQYPSPDSIVVETKYKDENGNLVVASRDEQKYNTSGKIISHITATDDGYGNSFIFYKTFFYYSVEDVIDSILFYEYDFESSGLKKSELWTYFHEEGQISEVFKMQKQSGTEDLVPSERELYSAYQGGLFGKKEYFEYNLDDGEVVIHSIDSIVFDNQDRPSEMYHTIFYDDGEIVQSQMQKIEYHEGDEAINSIDGLIFYNKVTYPIYQEEFTPENINFAMYKVKSVEDFELEPDSGVYNSYGIANYYYNDFTSNSSSLISETVFNISPNPVVDFLSIVGIEKLDISSYSVFSMDGQLLISKNLSSHNIDVSQLSSGVYVLILNSDKFAEPTIKKFVKF